MSDEKKPAEDPTAQPVTPPDTPAPAAAESPAGSLEVMPASTPMPGEVSPTPPAGDPNQSLVVPPAAGTPPPPAPIDYAMPTQRKSWLPSPQLIKNLGCIFKLLFGFTVMLVIGYVMLMAMNPKARQWALQGSKPGAAGTASGNGSSIGGGNGPTPFKAINQILAIPAQALGKTDDVVKANNARVGMLDGVIAEEEGKTKQGGGPGGSQPAVNPFLDVANSALAAANSPAGKAAPAPGGAAGAPTPEQERAANAARLMAAQEKLAALKASGAVPDQQADAVRATAVVQAPVETAPITLPGGIVIRSASPAGSPPASRTFVYWVVNLNISGINPPRLLLNGRLIYEQQEVQTGLGIVFDHFDQTEKLLVFRDQTGAIVTRSY